MLLPRDVIQSALGSVPTASLQGRVSRVAGLLVEGTLPGARLGMMAMLDGRVPAEVVALRDGSASLMPLGGVGGVGAGVSIRASASTPSIRVGPHVLGRVMDGWGRPLDGLGPIGPVRGQKSLPGWAESPRLLEALHAGGVDAGDTPMPLDPDPLNPLERGRVETPLPMGIRVLDGLLTTGAGQRMAVLAGAGVGKSTLLAQMCKNTAADVTVIGLIGERGREVKEFVEKDLGPDAMKRATLVVATSDQPGALRIRAAKAAFAVAEYFRDRGLSVLLLVDSLSRVAMAQRELGLAIGEPPATKGYPPSAFAIIPRLLERAGPGPCVSRGDVVAGGSITAFCTTLLEGDDLGDPVGDAVKATTDGHIVLSRSLADRGHFPAIDTLRSVSRVMNQLASPEHRRLARTIRGLLADHREVEELATIGAYQRGTVPKFDRALDAWPRIEAWLRQEVEETVGWAETLASLGSLVREVGA
ncbi:MAG: FliI/YscN family ATPase [Myxococcales bacterium]|nr:FliI/YscN family ATPase [Myxococcales bacterium]